MLSGLTAKTLGRYQDATKMIEKSMERLASGTADISSADKVKIQVQDIIPKIKIAPPK